MALSAYMHLFYSMRINKQPFVTLHAYKIIYDIS